uniref:Uncharacterized protein n=1 Tax=Setaria italica TaxID=4555 RepID=K3ZK87_SETIT
MERRRRREGRVDEHVDGEAGGVLAAHWILQGHDCPEEDGVVVGGNHAWLPQAAFELRPARPVEVQAGHRGRVGDPDGGADGPVGAGVGDLRRCAVRFVLHVPVGAVDEAVEDLPGGEGGSPREGKGSRFGIHGVGI